MFSLRLLCVLGTLLPPCVSYVDIRRPPKQQELYPRHPVPRPYRAPIDLTFSTAPLITALAQAKVLPGNKTYGAIYSIGYPALFGGEKNGRAVFARGVFASDPPGSTCTPCGNQATTIRANGTATASTTCSSPNYEGVFRSSVGG